MIMFSKRLKYLRKNKGLSQQKMADFLGISRQGYGKYEDGRSEPDHKTLIKIATYFNVTVDYLLGKANESDESNESDKNAIIDKIAKEFPDADLMFGDLASMDAEQLEEVYEFIAFKARRNKK